MSDVDEIAWEDPPRSLHGPQIGVWMQRLEPLTKHPKRWARVWDASNKACGSNAIQALKIRRYRYPAGRWEFTGRDSAVYARYLGPDEEDT